MPLEQRVFLSKQLLSFINAGRFDDVLGCMHDDVDALGCHGLHGYAHYVDDACVRGRLCRWLCVCFACLCSGAFSMAEMRPGNVRCTCVR